MNKATVKAIRNHAVACYPRESCGLVVMVGRSEKYWPCQNVAGDDDHFVISPADYAAAEDAGMVVGVVHSHPDETDAPSKADRIMCDESGQPWYIVAVSAEGAAETIRKIEPTGMQPPLIGRDFLFGVRDCYTLIRDFYQRVMHIELPDFERTDGFWERGEDLYMDNFTKAGFYRLQDSEPLQFGDVLLIQMRSDLANHGGVYIGAVTELDGKRLVPPLQNAFIHHRYGCKSQREVYGGQWRDNTLARIRYGQAKT